MEKQSNQKKINPQPSQAGSSNHLVFFFLAAIMLLCGMQVFNQSAIRHDANTLETESSTFNRVDQNLERHLTSFDSQFNQTCLPILTRNRPDHKIFYLSCSKQGEKKVAINLTKNFKVPVELVDRFLFWKNVYSVWHSDQHALHTSPWPEVVFEVIDTSDIDKNASYMKRIKAGNKIKKERRRHYRSLLSKMHKIRNQPEKFTASMSRIADLMKHIQDPNKFSVAANQLRTQTGQKNYIESGMRTAPQYLPMILKNFKAVGIPQEIALLAFVESSFNLKAFSKVGASGIYQIMPATGRQYLRVSQNIDERNDPIKASVAAAKLLKLNYKITQSWPLAITAYNHGVGGVQKAIRKVGSKNITKIVEKYHSRTFKFASRNFYLSFLAILSTMQNSQAIFDQIPENSALAFDELKIRRGASIHWIKRRYKMTNRDILSLNPDLSSRFVNSNGQLPKGYVIKVSRNSSQAKLEKKKPLSIRTVFENNQPSADFTSNVIPATMEL